jgi:ribonuclease D
MSENARHESTQDSIVSSEVKSITDELCDNPVRDAVVTNPDTELKQTSRRKRTRRKRNKSSFSDNRESSLLESYLQEYKIRMFDHYQLSNNYSLKDLNQNSLMNSNAPIMIYDTEFPKFDSELLDRPFLALGSKLNSRDRRKVHNMCDYLGLFHVSVDRGEIERYVAISIFHDGLLHVPAIETDLVSMLKLETFKPWIKQKHIDIEHETKVAKEQIYTLIDQPGKCLRDEIDQVDLVQLADEDLRNTTPPKPEDDNWMWVRSTESLEQCIIELQTKMPRELAFDVECLCKSKTQQLTCLIQLSTDDGREYVIDVLAEGVWEGVRKLGPLFADKSIVKVGHGVSGVDVPSLYRDFGIFIVNLFDTLEAARVLDINEKGLSSLCSHYHLPNCDRYNSLKEQYQMTDWTRRPLTEPMILYGRYDVHYLLRLRQLMMRDLVKLSLMAHFCPDRMGEDTSAMQDIIRSFNDDDGVDSDEDVGGNLHRFINAGEMDRRESSVSFVDDAKSLFQAQDLRMNLDLMKVISSCQDKSLCLWSDRPENHLKNGEYLAMMSQNKIRGTEWSMSQQKLYDRLAQWREEVGFKLGILPGFVCGTEFLAKLAQHRPASKIGLRQISFFLSPPLMDHLSELLEFIRHSREEDELPEGSNFPSYEACKKHKASRDISSEGLCAGKNNWLYYLGIVAALSAVAIFTKRRHG